MFPNHGIYNKHLYLIGACYYIQIPKYQTNHWISALCHENKYLFPFLVCVCVTTNAALAISTALYVRTGYRGYFTVATIFRGGQLIPISPTRGCAVISHTCNYVYFIL